MNARKKGRAKTFKTAQVIAAIEATRGNLSAAAAQLRCSRTTLYRYLRDHPRAQAALEEAREAMLDHAESMLYRKILEGDTTALIFFLKTQGKRRGYIERQEVTGRDGGPVERAVTMRHEFDYDSYSRLFHAVLGVGDDGAGDAPPDGAGEPVDPARPDG